MIDMLLGKLQQQEYRLSTALLTQLSRRFSDAGLLALLAIKRHQTIVELGKLQMLLSHTVLEICNGLPLALIRIPRSP
jgi:hypothetical protein